VYKVKRMLSRGAVISSSIPSSMSNDEWMSEEKGKRDILKLIIAEIKLVAQPVGSSRGCGSSADFCQRLSLIS
jgi:hypothetical protein